ncbi:MAG: ribosomal RNA small subunit methyltransferase A [Deltaproteobacteria bacterium]|nr:ribosomal RNA small subunit methyltransferase A [Deltaproteobacteria bacterium]MDQ3295030.1 16S rRNA (adenine(1518)-N(6)/adenine(1519)-N(6))-dimethyltransferase RsmA [Myxococcota bacterium]
MSEGNGRGIAREDPFPDARVLLDRYGLRAKKAFGQNFLISERAFRAIVDATVRADDDWIVEIGAGLGTLTSRIAERVSEGKVIALERDPDMVTVLRAELAGVDNVEIESVDALRYDLRMAARWRGDKIIVCGNLPYHIAAPLMFKVLEARAVVQHAVFMIQKEMADRIVAAPGTKDYGALGVMIRTYADVLSVAKVGAGSFVPPPKIDSTVIKIVPLANAAPRCPIGDDKHYSAVVHAAFGQRRKTLRNALRAAFEEAAVDAALATTKIDGIRRGETLDIAEFGALAAEISPTSLLAK